MSLAVDRGGRPLGVQEAYNALGDYARTYGEVPLRLLLHAAVPQSFRAGLLNLLKVNFVPEAGGDLSVDADVLLSPLVEATAAGYFRLDPEVRRQSLDLLDAVYRSDGSRRSIRVARFLIAWLDHLERADAAGMDPLLAEYAVIQRWVAMALIDPPAVAAALARSLSDALAEEEGAVRARLGGIAAALSIPLAGHQPLLSYAQGIDALRTGNADAARQLLEPLGDSEIRIGDVTLRPAADLLDAYLPGDREQPPGPGAGATGEPGAMLINVPPPPGLFIGRQQELEQARAALLQPPTPSIVVLAGPDGIGRFTLARVLAHDRQIQDRYSDAIIWLDEEGIVNPLQWLGDKLKVAGASSTDGLISEDTLRQWLARRRVLFVIAGQGDDAVIMLERVISASCAILCRRGYADSPYNATATISIASLALSDAEELSAHFRAWKPTPTVDALIAQATAGNPLLIHLLNSAMHCTVDTNALINHYEPPRFEALVKQVAGVTSSDPQAFCSIICEDLVSALTADEQASLFRVLEAQGWPTQLSRAASDEAWPDPPSELRRCLISDVFGDVVRIHPLVRDALHALAPKPNEKRAADRFYFISYSRVDGEDFALKLYDQLTAGPPRIGVWLDRRRLQSGIDWDEQLVEALRACEGW